MPRQYLDTLQVKLPPDVSGTLTIGVQAGTVDYDDNTEVSTIPLVPPTTSGAGVNVAVSGSATLSLIKFDPVADAVTMALNGRAAGREDEAIPLAIRTTSSDVSETFNVTISGIPAGATITYDGAVLSVTGGSVSIVGFDNSVPMTITPPPHSNTGFRLTVSAVSVDGAAISAPVSRTIDVSVTGVADTPVVTLAPAYGTTEAVLDGAGSHRVALSSIVSSVGSADADGSEVSTLRVTGLAEGFSVAGATMVVSGTGTERVWVVAGGNLASVAIVSPPNYSGTVNFQVAGVTTENDGDSRTGVLTNVSFTVMPSPEATITTSATLVEDIDTPLNLAIVHQNGDTDETLGQIYIPADYATGADFVLYLGGVPLGSAGVGPTTVSGVTGLPNGDYYVIPAAQVGDLGAKGGANLDGGLGALNFFYEVTDPSSDGTLAAVTEIRGGTLALDATPVTDAVDASITVIAMDTATGTAPTPDTATVTASGSVTVGFHVGSADTDGTEHLIRIVITGVPDGVTVSGASQLGSGSWLLVYDGWEAQSIDASGVDVPVEFIVGRGASNGSSTITMTAQAQDRGNLATATTLVERDSVSWTLDLNLSDGQPYTPPEIEWSYINGASGTEDEPFVLGDVMEARVSTSDAGQAHSYTVSITDLPAGTTVAGMTLTTVNGVPTWTATVTVPAGEDSHTALDTLLAGITITPPENANKNNAGFSFDAKLTASAVGGPSVERNVADANMPVVPVTDPAVITVTTGDVGEGTQSVSATIAVGMPADGSHGQIVGGKLYVQVSTANNDGGTVTDSGGNPLTLVAVSGVPGVPDGDYYVIDVDPSGGTVALVYRAADGTVLEPGSVTFTAHAQTQETGAGNVATAVRSGTAQVEIINNGVTVDSQPITGSEAATSDKANAIQLSGLSVTLNDRDFSESIHAILLSGVPVGFLLYVGNDAGDATVAAQASNAGGDGATNTWVLSSDGTMPAYVAILPAVNWSGTLSNLALVVESGETSLPTARVDTVPLQPVTVEPVPNGVVINPTLSFGREGQVIALNLNAAMADPAEAIAEVPDASTETTTLQFTGLGVHAAFYVGGTLVDSVSYDAGADTYTVTGLSQDDLDSLGFVQAASALVDQDAAAAGTQVRVTAWTVESGNGATSAPVADTLTLAVTKVLATTGDNTFLWDGAAINGRAGEDTVALRHGESLTGAELAARLTNIETIDLGVGGSNAITGLTAAQVASMTDGDNTLTITGSADDSVSLSGSWTANGDGTYTGASGVSLMVDGGVAVTDGVAPFMLPFAAFGDAEGFGLASLDTHEQPRQTEPEAGPVTLDDLLSMPAREEDLMVDLPDEDRSATPTFRDGGDAAQMPGPGLQDELQSTLFHEV